MTNAALVSFKINEKDADMERRFGMQMRMMKKVAKLEGAVKSMYLLMGSSSTRLVCDLTRSSTL
jgi:hypothetical protein